MKQLRTILYAIVLISISLFSLLPEQELLNHSYKKFVIVVASYNNQAWYMRNLDSIFAQQYPYFRVIYIDDASSDETGSLVEHYIKDRNQSRIVTLIRNKERAGALKNIYNAVHDHCGDDEIVAMLDGDDWFSNPQVLSVLNTIYSRENVWLTYGQFSIFPTNEVGKCHAYPPSVIEQNAFREYPWIASHLRTCYAWLFKKIKPEDLQINGNFFSMTWDQALMFPMLEMARERIRCIQDVLYIYNVANPINDQNVNPILQHKLGEVIRRLPKYDRIADEQETSSKDHVL